MGESRRQFLKSAAAAAMTTSMGCGGGSRRSSTRPNVVVFVVDTLRADRMSLYGHARDTTPFLTDLAKESVVFTDAVAPAPWTIPSVGSVFSGLYPGRHCVFANGARIHAPDSPLLAETMRALGYRTLQLTRNPFTMQFGLDRGFDHLLDSYRQPIETTYPYFQAPEPVFAYIHIIDPHDPFRLFEPSRSAFASIKDEQIAPVNRMLERNRVLSRVVGSGLGWPGTIDALTAAEEAHKEQQLAVARDLAGHRETVELLYDTAVHQSDQTVRKFVTWMKEQGLWDNTLFVLLSDHGEELYERGYWQHDQSLYRELVHVPLLVRYPGAGHGGRVVEHTVSLVDIAPTIHDVLGGDAQPDAWQGVSLATPGGAAAEDAIRCVAQRVNLSKRNLLFERQRGHINLAFREGPWKGIWNSQPDTWELYHLARDPGEKDNLAASAPAVVERMRAFRSRRFDSDWASILGREWGIGRDRQLDEDVRENIETLGYL